MEGPVTEVYHEVSPYLCGRDGCHEPCAPCPDGGWLSFCSACWEASVQEIDRAVAAMEADHNKKEA